MSVENETVENPLADLLARYAVVSQHEQALITVPKEFLQHRKVVDEIYRIRKALEEEKKTVLRDIIEKANANNE